MWALNSEGMATGGGQIIVAETAFKHVRSHFQQFEELADENGNRFYKVGMRGALNKIKIQADAMKLRSQISNELLTRIQDKMQQSVPQSIIPYLQINQERYGSENRSLTVMFVSLGVELSSAESEQGM